MSAVTMAYAWERSPYTGSTFLVHLALGDIANDANGHELWMLTKSIAKKARVSVPSARRALKRLVEDGYLEVLDDQSDNHRASRYRFLMPSDPKPAGETPKEGSITMTDPAGKESITMTDRVDHHDRRSITMTDRVDHHDRPKELERRTTNQLKGEHPEIEADASLASPTGVAVDTNQSVDPQVIELVGMLQRYVTNWHGRPVKAGKQWVRDMDLLVRRGPTEWEKPEPIPPETVERAIRFVFTKLTARGADGFCWADVIQSPRNLRKHWMRLVTEAQKVKAKAGTGDRESRREALAELRAREQARKQRFAAIARERGSGVLDVSGREIER